MATITASLVKELRDATKVSMMECKRALQEADGDLDAAMKCLRERGMAVAAKKATRTANQGMVSSSASEDGKTVSLVEVNCETDFVTRNQTFIDFVKLVSDNALDTDEDLSVVMKDELTAKIAEIGENMKIKRNIRYISTGNCSVASYIHLGGKVGVLVELDCGKAETQDAPAFKELIKDITLHVAAMAPKYLNSDSVDAEEIASERAIYTKQVEDKPANIIDKIVDGKMNKFFSEICLVNQGFVKEPKQSITELLEEVGKQLGDTISIVRYVRFQLGT
ncbi:MAG: translation elongation factor Ts [Kiritimatiellae bacterium]|nr:translation elongation factor Ts [Kiritimatiellia bacterium]